MELWRAALFALWLFLPCYMANMAPVAAARLIPNWASPLDGGRMAKDGRRLLGPNKTWRGLASGALAGALTAAALAWLGGSQLPDFGRMQGATWPGVAAFGGLLGLFALAGDAAKSYVKRRTGREGGAPWFPFDQLDFVAGGLLGAAVGAPLVAGWAWQAYFGDWVVLAALVLLTPLLHWGSSVLAYWGGLKKAPW